MDQGAPFYLGIIEIVQWCDTRDMTAGGHAKGSIDRELLLDVMAGNQTYKHDVKSYTPFRGTSKTAPSAHLQY